MARVEVPDLPVSARRGVTGVDLNVMVEGLRRRRGEGVVRPTIEDVAAKARVSIGTVSNVLNRPELVSEDKRLRVERAIETLGFVRNASARQLRMGLSRTLAYVVLDMNNPFFTDVARGIDEVARDLGLMLFLCNSDQDVKREDDYFAQLLEQRVKGICVTTLDDRNPRLEQLQRLGMPVVLVDHTGPEEDKKWCSVGVDDRLGGQLALTHLLELGHDRIAFVGGPMYIRQVSHRLEGAQSAVAATGHPADALTELRTDALTVEQGRRAGARLIGLPRRRRPTAVFCANDLLALGVLQHMTQHGVRVPDDIAIVGYDDIDFAAAAAVPLTSVSQPRHQLGRTAAELIL